MPSVTLTLHFKPSVEDRSVIPVKTNTTADSESALAAAEVDTSTTQQQVMEEWGLEEIDDFILRLGFLEAKKDEEEGQDKKDRDQVQQFMDLNDV